MTPRGDELVMKNHTSALSPLSIKTEERNKAAGLRKQEPGIRRQEAGKGFGFLYTAYPPPYTL
jgi:hypothetical protein